LASTAIEIFKSIGALGGIASSAFLIHDRMNTGRPRLTWSRQDKHFGMVVENTADEIILIQGIETGVAELEFAKSAELDDIIHHIWKKHNPNGLPLIDRSILLGVGRTRFFPLLSSQVVESHNDLRQVRVKWRFARKRWQSRFPVKLAFEPSLHKQLMNGDFTDAEPKETDVNK
jgi:hypothetical protein